MNIFSSIFGFFVLIWNSILFNPAINIFVFFYKISDSNLGLAIVILTIVLRIALWPLLKSQLESTKNMQKVQPRLAEIQKKYASDVVKLREEQMKLFKEEEKGDKAVSMLDPEAMGSIMSKQLQNINT